MECWSIIILVIIFPILIYKICEYTKLNKFAYRFKSKQKSGLKILLRWKRMDQRSFVKSLSFVMFELIINKQKKKETRKQIETMHQSFGLNHSTIIMSVW